MRIFIICYVLAMSVFGFSLMLYDKKQARLSQRRIPEKTLFLVTALGGALGTLIGMQVARHKTKHWSFLIGIPFLLLVNFLFIYPMAFFGVEEWITYVIYFFTG